MRKSNLEMVVSVALQNTEHASLDHSDNGYVDSHHDYYDGDPNGWSAGDYDEPNTSSSSSGGGSFNEFIDGCGKFCIYFVLGLLGVCLLIALLTG